MTLAGSVAALAIGGALTASPAFADTFSQSCNNFTQFEVCISYDYTNGNAAVNVLNEQNVTQSYIMDLVQTRTNTAEIEHATIAPYSWFGFPWHLGEASPGQLCGYVYWGASGAYAGGVCATF
jgi:hypothetical protein